MLFGSRFFPARGPRNTTIRLSLHIVCLIGFLEGSPGASVAPSQEGAWIPHTRILEILTGTGGKGSKLRLRHQGTSEPRGGPDIVGRVFDSRNLYFASIRVEKIDRPRQIIAVVTDARSGPVRRGMWVHFWSKDIIPVGRGLSAKISLVVETAPTGATVFLPKVPGSQAQTTPCSFEVSLPDNNEVHIEISKRGYHPIREIILVREIDKKNKEVSLARRLTTVARHLPSGFEPLPGRVFEGWPERIRNTKTQAGFRLINVGRSVSWFYLAEREVSNELFTMFLNDDFGRRQSPKSVRELIDLEGVRCGIGYERMRYTPKPGQEKLPALHVKWRGAEAFCEWAGCQLPTVTQWERAANANCDTAYWWGALAPGYPGAQALRVGVTGLFRPLSVEADMDRNPASGEGHPFGLTNLIGNAMEWSQQDRAHGSPPDSSHYLCGISWNAPRGLLKTSPASYTGPFLQYHEANGTGPFAGFRPCVELP